ncbi:modification methylase HindV [Patiriisocius marinistellae]|uniref:Cytosine-specific methyltransferase n=1 Tax=Patiriisocius marinistellae TaxID=2494560 RepID=A0A5J4FYQ2_9FLAO|nr:DNA cytosine methyltransferase [Patiriisocius marinistellae]GEQ87410.1 modification methylase HindV [Patiriisocius marinistellae]
MEKDKIRTVDLFSGCGGMSLGFQNAGFDIVAAFDNWKPAVEVYKENFDHPIYDFDLSTDESKEFINELKPNLIIGGPPCQDFSSAGKRDDTLGRADLTISYAKIISSVKPEYFIMENVERIKKSRILKEAIDILRDSGYGITMTVLNASLCGVPQARKRFFMIGRLKEKDDFLMPYINENLSEKPMTVFDYLGNSLGVENYYRHPRSYKRRGVFSIHEPSPTVRGVNRPIPAGYPRHSGDPVDVSENVRSLTTKERSYIQTFPKSFKFNGTKTNLEQIIGNAVPVKLGEYLANCLTEYIADKKLKKYKNYGQVRMALEPESTVPNNVYSS